MYKIVGADGKEYGPVSLEQLRQWVGQGRINTQTRVLPPGATEWKMAGQLPELQDLLSGGVPPAPGAPMGAPVGGPPKTGLAVTSLVLGILSFLCLGLLAGIPAIICGHIAHNRAKRSPTEYGGGGMAIAGFVMGYASLLMTFVLAAMLLPALAKAKSRATSINCVNNMKQIGLAYKVWELDHNDQFPFAVSTNAGGTMEVSAQNAQGFDLNPARQLIVLSNELATPKILVCPEDSKKPALDWQSFGPANVSYQIRSSTNLGSATPQQILAICPIHGNELRCDGSVQMKSRNPRRTSR